MKILLNFRCIMACLAITATFLLQSCNDEQTYDVVGSSVNKIYINTQEWSPINTPKNAFSFSIVHTPVGEFGTVLAKFPVRSTIPMSQSATVVVELDNSLVDAYNKKYGTKCVALPDGVLNINNATATIAEGASLSGDSISVSIDSSKLSLLTEKAYLAPIKLISVSESGSEISSQYNTAYVLVNTSTSRIKANVGSSGMLGALISGYSTWTVTSDITASRYTYSYIFDGSTSTSWRFSGSAVTLVIDMKANKNVSGFRLYAQYATYGYIFSQAKISLSTDNVTFDEVGTSTNSNMAIESGYQYIGFYGAIQARYVKLALTWNNTNYPYICELGVYTVN